MRLTMGRHPHAPTHSRAATGGLALVLLLLAAGSAPAAAQSTPPTITQPPTPGGTIAGQVFESSGRSGLGAVTLVVEGTRLGGATGADGRFRIVGVPAGPHVLVARRIGYEQQRRPITVAAGTETTVASVTFKRRPDAPPSTAPATTPPLTPPTPATAPRTTPPASPTTRPPTTPTPPPGL